ncbi:MAG: prenyltransferase [Pseudomonadota bacterium]
MTTQQEALTPWTRWVYAAKPKSWPKLLVPMALGQGLGAYVAGGVSVPALAFGVLFVVADLLYIVFLNDWGDAAVDRIKRQMFPNGCSPKTIPDRILPSRAVLLAGLAAGAIAVGMAFLFEATLGRPGLGLAGLVALAIFWAYTLPPLRLNYRGGGELLEAIGVGAVLPWLNAYAQSGVTWDTPYGLLGPFVVLSLASALASGLADERSDREGGKRTGANTLGNPATRRLVEALVLLGAAGWALSPWWLGSGLPWAVPALAAAVAFALVPRLLSTTRGAVTDAFREQGLYKLELHRAIWWSATILAAMLAALAELT